MNIKDQILALAKTFKVKKLDVDGIDGGLYIREISAGDREALEDAISKETIGSNLRATVFVKSVCDADGKLQFSDKDIKAVNDLPLSVVNAVFQASNELNGLGSGEAEVEDAEKN